MKNTEIENRVKKQLALELNCRADDFDRDCNVITRACLPEGRRMFSDDPFFLQMATFGGNAVISADERILPWLTEWAKDKQGFRLFEQDSYYELECELRKYGFSMAPTHYMFLPGVGISDAEPQFEIRWLEQKDVHPFYGKKEFPNALCDIFRPERPDVLAIVALDGDMIMGMAGCSADSPSMWQIGIDVLPEYRGRGVGKGLVTLLKNEAIRRGAIPYYGTSLSNMASWKVALGSGFVPTWIETESRLNKEER